MSPLRDPIWHVTFRSGAVLAAQTAIRFFFTFQSPEMPFLCSQSAWCEDLLKMSTAEAQRRAPPVFEVTWTPTGVREHRKEADQLDDRGHRAWRGGSIASE